MPSILLAVISIIEFAVLLIPVIQWVYFAVYKTSVNENALSAMLQTDYNESIEFYKSLPKIIQLFCPIFLLMCIYTIINANTYINLKSLHINFILIMAITVFLSIYLWRPNKKGVFLRTGILDLLNDVRHYMIETRTYSNNLSQRLADLQVTPNKPQFEKPSTIIMVIGESATRNYMKAFNNNNDETTPWLSKNKNEFLLFNNSYSCAWNTVPALEHALTEANYYNNKEFNRSISIIDIAKKAGYKTY